MRLAAAVIAAGLLLAPSLAFAQPAAPSAGGCPRPRSTSRLEDPPRATATMAGAVGTECGGGCAGGPRDMAGGVTATAVNTWKL